MAIHPVTYEARRVWQLTVCLSAVLAVLFAGTASASAATTKRTVSFKVSPASVVTGAKVILSGKVTKSPKSTKIRIEVRSGRTWRSFKNVKTTSKRGTFRTTFRAQEAGTFTYRAKVLKAKKLKAATSKAVTVTVKPSPVPPGVGSPPVLQPPAVVPPLSARGKTEKISQAPGGGPTDGGSSSPDISADGRYIAYNSEAPNVFPGSAYDNGGDTVLKDRVTGELVRVSEKLGDGQPGTWTHNISVSDDGRYVSYSSLDDDLVAGDSNGEVDVFLWDRVTGVNSLVSNASDGGPSNGGSYPSVISGNGRYVAFHSFATNLVEGSGCRIFLRDLLTGTTTRACDEGSGFIELSAISADGRYVVYQATTAGDPNNDEDDFTNIRVWDRTTGQSRGVTNLAAGEATASDISADGRYVVFTSAASSLVAGDVNNDADVFVWDGQSGTTRKVSQAADGTGANGVSRHAVITGDGRYIAFDSTANNLVGLDADDVEDVFVWDRQSGTTRKVSQAANGGAGDSDSSGPAISADGRYIAYNSSASNLVPGDTNGLLDVFLWDRDS
jgi:Tol biopolymer transport system component